MDRSGGRPVVRHQRTGAILGALPDQGLAAFELGTQTGADTPQIVAQLQRGGASAFTQLAAPFTFTAANAFKSSSSAYGTLIAYQYDRYNTAYPKGRILRPDGTWEDIPKLADSAYDFGSYGSRLLSQATLTDNGTVFYTDAIDNIASMKITEIPPGNRSAPASVTLGVAAPPVAPIRTTVTSNGFSLAFYAGANQSSVRILAHEAGVTSWNSFGIYPIPDGGTVPTWTGYATPPRSRPAPTAGRTRRSSRRFRPVASARTPGA